MKASLHASFATLTGSVVLLLSASAFAAGEPCLNDTDCPGTECGSEVCNWNKPLENPANPDKPYTCNPAGTDPKGKDGWCSDNSADYCKCKALGATCTSNFFYCSFTRPQDAPAGSTGGAGTGGAGTGGGGASTGGGGTTSTGGTTAGTGGSGAATGGSAAAPAPAADEGGCSVSAPRGGSSVALGLGLLGLGYALARRRR